MSLQKKTTWKEIFLSSHTQFSLSCLTNEQMTTTFHLYENNLLVNINLSFSESFCVCLSHTYL